MVSPGKLDSRTLKVPPLCGTALPVGVVAPGEADDGFGVDAGEPVTAVVGGLGDDAAAVVAGFAGVVAAGVLAVELQPTTKRVPIRINATKIKAGLFTLFLLIMICYCGSLLI